MADHPSRRSALAKLGMGLAATSTLATASAFAAPEASVSPELVRLIEAHLVAWDVFIKTVDDIGVDRAAVDAEDDLVLALCAYPCRTIEEARVKAAHLRRYAPGLVELGDSRLIEALLQSFGAET
jgi:hypothetical protein